MISPIHALATAAASATEAVLQIPRQVGAYFEGPEALAADLPPRVQEALASIPDPEQRYLLTLVARGDLVPAGVPEGIDGPDLNKGTAGVTDYLAKLLHALGAAKSDSQTQGFAGVDEGDLDESIAQIEGLLRRIDPSHPALRQTASTAADPTVGGTLDLVA